MTVFQLMVFSCVRVVSLGDGEIMSMSCRWEPSGIYVTEALCIAGAPKIGNPIFSDMFDGRKVEKIRCSPLNIVDK